MKALYRNLPGVKRLCEKKTAKYQRICIIGNSDAGKSTLTLELGALFQLPVLHIDRLYWQPGRVKTPKDVYLPELRKAIAEEKRIIDGNNKGTSANRLELCDIYGLIPVFLLPESNPQGFALLPVLICPRAAESG